MPGFGIVPYNDLIALEKAFADNTVASFYGRTYTR
jgi:acetylornithine/succinyldiaminopimelate/putrescine aminotransferase